MISNKGFIYSIGGFLIIIFGGLGIITVLAPYGIVVALGCSANAIILGLAMCVYGNSLSPPRSKMCHICDQPCNFAEHYKKIIPLGVKPFTILVCQSCYVDLTMDGWETAP